MNGPPFILDLIMEGGPFISNHPVDAGKENDVDIWDKKDTMRRMIIQKNLNSNATEPHHLALFV